jgi:hypothetical protein
MLERIKNCVLSKNPNEKMFIYIGAHHCLKGEYGYYNMKWLGGLLNDFNEGNIASINVTTPDKVTIDRNMREIPINIGFNTNNNFLGNYILHRSYPECLSNYYKYYDGMIVLGE